MINQDLSYTPIRPLQSFLGRWINFLIILSCLGFCVKKIVLFEQGSESTVEQAYTDQSNVFQEKMVFVFEHSSGPQLYEDLKQYIKIEFGKKDGGALSSTIQNCQTILTDKKAICISTQDGQLSQNLQILINKCDGATCQSGSKIDKFVKKLSVTIYIYNEDSNNLKEVATQKLNPKSPSTLEINLQKKVESTQKWYVFPFIVKFTHEIKGNQVNKGATNAKIFQTDLIQESTEVVKSSIEYNLFNLSYEAGGAIYFLQMVFGLILRPFLTYSGKIDVMKKIYKVKSKTNIFKSDDINNQRIKISACWYLRLFFMDIFCCKCCYRKKSKSAVSVADLEENQDMNSEIQDLTMRNIDQDADEKKTEVKTKDEPKMSERLGLLMIEVNQKMQDEFQWIHILKKDVINIDKLNEIQLEPMEQIQSDLRRPEMENEMEIYHKSFEGTKSSYGTFYNDNEASRNSRSRNNFSYKNPISLKTAPSYQRDYSYNRTAREFVPVTKDDYLVKSPRKRSPRKSSLNQNQNLANPYKESMSQLKIQVNSRKELYESPKTSSNPKFNMQAFRQLKHNQKSPQSPSRFKKSKF